MMLLLVGFGGAISSGGLFNALTWSSVGYAVLAIFLVRPLAGWLCLAGMACPPIERAVISFFGIRGLGSIYYLAYAMHHAKFDNANLLWSTAGFIILGSIVLHGITVTPAMRRLDHRRRLAARA